eukprot:SAG31_NODE_7123_length_1783_cov_1.226247_1_plen_277_part_00
MALRLLNRAAGVSAPPLRRVALPAPRPFSGVATNGAISATLRALPRAFAAPGVAARLAAKTVVATAAVGLLHGSARATAMARCEQAVSLADQIRQLDSLRDKGIITESEFVKAKQRLLGTADHSETTEHAPRSRSVSNKRSHDPKQSKLVTFPDRIKITLAAFVFTLVNACLCSIPCIFTLLSGAQCADGMCGFVHKFFSVARVDEHGKPLSIGTCCIMDCCVQGCIAGPTCGLGNILYCMFNEEGRTLSEVIMGAYSVHVKPEAYPEIVAEEAEQ